ncbi:MAG: hypothetical protein KKH94_11360 [Candidatus Omnitrophica bacterium]|nr:hypothetical protein [Candidatus Omnitrophota bacterium]
MITKKGWLQSLMLSLFTKEATYNAGVTMIDANACSMKGFELTTEFPDVVTHDRDEVSGLEHGSDQEIIEQRVNLTYTEPKAKPNSLIGLAALVLGKITTTKDGAFDAYSHKIVPAPIGDALPSISIEHLKGAIQYKFDGIKGNTLKISGEAGGLVSLEAALIGAGSRAISSTEFAAAIAESWLKVNSMKIWLESGATIEIGASLTQGTQNISSGTPSDLGVRFKSFNFNWNNNLEEQVGAGGAGVLQDADYGRRSSDLTISLLFGSQDDLDLYLNQTIVAIEFDLAGAEIEAGAKKFGFHLIIPKLRLSKAPLPQGGPGDTLTCDFEMSVFNDGINDAVIIEGYNAVPEYLG